MHICKEPSTLASRNTLRFILTSTLGKEEISVRISGNKMNLEAAAKWIAP